MSYQNLETLAVVVDGAVRHLFLNRPDKRNAFNGRMVDELHRVFGELAADDGARVVVLAGRGKSFCAGADLGWMRDQAKLSPAESERDTAHMGGAFLAIARCPKPVVAKIHGHALGGGTGLAAAVDIAICTEETLFGLTETKLGIVPAVISPFVLQKIGESRGRALFLTAERFDGREAERVGLVHRAVASGDLDGAVDGVIAQLLTSAPAAVASAKRLIATVAPLGLEAAAPVTAKWIAELRATPEAQEGMSAFLEKRLPNWVAPSE